MILKELIRPHITYKDKISPQAAEQIAQQVEKFFTDLGWKIRTRKGRKDNKKDFKFTAHKDHVSIRYRINSYSEVTIHYRSAGGGTVKDGDWHYWNTDLQEAVNHANKIKPVERITKKHLPEPFTFKDEPLVAKKHDFRKWNGGVQITVHRTGQIRSIVTKGVVGLDDKGVVSPEQVMVPGEIPYFFLSCSAPSGATFNLITDGEIAYAVKRYGKHRVTNDPNPKATVDLNELTSQDKELVQIAITGYLNQDELDWI